MSFGGMLVQTAKVYRRALEDAPETELAERIDEFGQRQVEDEFGQPADASVLVGSYPCRVTRPSGGEVMAERSHDVAQDQRTLYLNPDVPLREDDEVTVLDKAGRPIVVLADVKLLKPVYDGQGSLHHLEARLTTQRPSGGLSTAEAGSG